MDVETFFALDLYGVRIHASSMLEPEFFVVDDWSNPAKNNRPEWRSIWCIGKEAMVAHPTVLKAIADNWESLKPKDGETNQ